MDMSYLTWPFFEEHHQTLSAQLHVWCRTYFNDNDIEPEHNHEHVRTECRLWVQRLAEGGWLRYLVEKRYGGVFDQIDLRSVCLIRETLASYSGLLDFAFAMQGLGSCTISLFGDENQKSVYLPAVVEGHKIAAFALTEESSGSDVANLGLSAQPQNDGFILNGGKAFISNAGLADFYVVFARTGEQPGARGISAFIVDEGTQGLDTSRAIRVNAPHPIGYMDFKNCVVKKEYLLGTQGQGFRQAMKVLDMFRCSVGAAALGFSRRALDEASRRASQRRLFGQLLADNLITQSKLGEMALDVDASALLIYRAAWTFDSTGVPTAKLASMAKLYATEQAQSVIDKAVQIFGGKGVTIGCPVESLYREIRSLRIYEGASEVQKLVIGKRHLDAYKAAIND